jgi:hypothetical protein
VQPMNASPGPADRHFFHYTLFGLTVRSAMELPELRPADRGAVDVEIGFRDLGAAAAGKEAAGLTMTAGGAVLRVPQVGRYLIEQGCRIFVDPEDGVSPRNVRLFLLGSAFGALLHQRGLLPLHANAIVIDGRAVAFTGASGAGKSTLASLFHDRGHRLLSDDVCVVDVDEGGRPIVHAGIPQMRLWRDSLEQSGRAVDDFERVLDGRDKYSVPTPGSDHAAAPLGAVYVLKRADEDGGRIGIRRLRGAEALKALIANTYRGRYIALLGDARRHWAASLDLVATVPVFELERPWSTACFAATLDAVEAHLRTDPG